MTVVYDVTIMLMINGLIFPDRSLCLEPNSPISGSARNVQA
jgi:hypothetical protein